MKFFITILLISILASFAFADQKAFYDTVTKKYIVDVSGKKTKEQILLEFNLTNCQEIAFDETFEGARIIDGNLEKYNYIQENKDIADLEEAKQKQKEAVLKEKLNLTDEDLEILRDKL